MVIIEIIKNILRFIIERKKWILVPVIIALLFFGVLIVLSSTTSVAPFIYTIF